MLQHSSNKSHTDPIAAPKWIVKKACCACHRGRWFAHLPGIERATFTEHAIALRYAVDPRFRSHWKAANDLARLFPAPTAAMRGIAL